jgi:hypothetical protein
MPEVSQIVSGRNPYFHIPFWIVTFGVQWNAMLVFN